ncbi:hypothetical protein L1887_56033 [Cichorium endivia]|nr:hypothetical protein L1887_56033 [Cichorium endivia]
MTAKRGADEVTPTLVGEDPGEEETTVPERGSVRDDGSAHGVVTADTDAHDETEDGEPDGDAVAADRVGSRDLEDDGDDDNDELLAVDGGTTKHVTAEAEEELADNVTDVGGGLEHTALQTPVDVLGALGVVGEEDDGVDDVDDEEIPGVHQETDTGDGEKLSLSPRDGEARLLLVPLDERQAGVAGPGVHVLAESHFVGCDFSSRVWADGVTKAQTGGRKVRQGLGGSQRGGTGCGEWREAITSRPGESHLQGTRGEVDGRGDLIRDAAWFGRTGAAMCEEAQPAVEETNSERHVPSDRPTVKAGSRLAGSKA